MTQVWKTKKKSVSKAGHPKYHPVIAPLVCITQTVPGCLDIIDCLVSWKMGKIRKKDLSLERI